MFITFTSIIVRRVLTTLAFRYVRPLDIYWSSRIPSLSVYIIVRYLYYRWRGESGRCEDSLAKEQERRSGATVDVGEGVRTGYERRNQVALCRMEARCIDIGTQATARTPSGAHPR